MRANRKPVPFPFFSWVFHVSNDGLKESRLDGDTRARTLAPGRNVKNEPDELMALRWGAAGNAAPSRPSQNGQECTVRNDGGGVKTMC